MRLWVIDTNVVVSGLRVPQGQPAAVLLATSQGRIGMAYDARILEEYKEVLLRRRLGFSPQVIAKFLADMQQQHWVTPVRRGLSGPDPADLKFIEVALATPDKTIVTGNLRDYPPELCQEVRVLTPAQAVAEL